MNNLTKSVLIRDGKIIGAVGDKIYTSTPIGSMFPFAGTSIPNGFLVCDGRSVNAEQYSELYGIIGTTYGGDDINFNLPTITSDTESVKYIIKAYHTNEGADTGVSDDIINYINSSYASKETPISQAEYDALDEQTKLENDYRCYDTGRLYYKGILYGGGETKEITYEEYKTMKENGELDENTEYLVVVDESDILLMGNDIGYSNIVSGIEATTVQGAIDVVNTKVDNMIDDESVDENTVLSSKKTTEELEKKTDKDFITGILDANNAIGENGINIFVMSASSVNIPLTRTGIIRSYTTIEDKYIRVNQEYSTIDNSPQNGGTYKRYGCSDDGGTTFTWSGWNFVGSIDDSATALLKTWSSSKIKEYVDENASPTYSGTVIPTKIASGATITTDWNITNGGSNADNGRLLMLNGTSGTFLIHIKGNLGNTSTLPTPTVVSSIASSQSGTWSTDFELSISSSKLRIKNKSGAVGSWRFV